jgi:SlyX protein
MNEWDDLTARLDALETRAAFQDRTIEDLNETITSQWKQIDWLTRQISQLLERVQHAEDRVGSPPPAERPPHY